MHSPTSHTTEIYRTQIVPYPKPRHGLLDQSFRTYSWNLESQIGKTEVHNSCTCNTLSQEFAASSFTLVHPTLRLSFRLVHNVVLQRSLLKVIVNADLMVRSKTVVQKPLSSKFYRIKLLICIYSPTKKFCSLSSCFFKT